MKKIDIKTRDGLCDAFEFVPQGEGPFIPVLMLMDAIGVRKAILDIAEKFCKEGFYVLVPNLFYRYHKAPFISYPEKFTSEELSKFFPKVMPWMTHLTPDKFTSDADTYLDHVEKQNVEMKKCGIIGYCMGGRLGTMAAERFPERVHALVSLHAGRLVSDGEESLHNQISKIKASMYFGHADKDPHMTKNQIALWEKTLKENHKIFESEILSEAPHGFTQNDLPAYREDAFERTFAKAVELFRG